MNGPERRKRPDRAVAPAGPPVHALRASREVPFLKLFGFYAILIGIASALVYYVPFIRDAWLTSPVVETFSGFGRSALETGVESSTTARGFRAPTVLLIALGALALSLPVAWVYTYTRRLRYDPSLVHSVIILPMVVSGIVVVVKNSVALAFSLAGIVAVVRFRNTLKDPKDAVYIFLALGIGLAAGVQAIDIALVISLLFNTVILVLWKYNLGAIYGETQRDLLAVGDRTLMIARTARQRDAIRWRALREARDMDTDGVLLVHAHDPETAKQHIELTLANVAEDWRVSEDFRLRDGVSTFAIMIQMDDKKGDPLALLAEIDERWSQEIAAAEYLPFKKPAEKKKETSDDEK